MWIVGGYRIDYVEKKKSNGLWVEYERIITVKDSNNEIVMCSEGKSEGEFLNYLGFVTNELVVEKAKEIFETVRTEEDDARDFVDLCAEHEYLWWG